MTSLPPAGSAPPARRRTRGGTGPRTSPEPRRVHPGCGVTAGSCTPGAGPETEQLLREVIAVLAGAFRDADKRRLRPARARPAVVNPVRPVAAALVRCVADGDKHGAEALLARRRTHSEWSRLVLALASAADPARLAVPAGPKAA